MDGRTEVDVVSMPLTWSCVCVSVRSNFRTSTDRPKWCRKSAPKIACITSATMKIHWKGWRRPRFNVSERVPNVAMEDWLTACREYLLARCVCGGTEGGITLTSVSVLTRKRKPEFLSLRLSERPAALVATSGWPARSSKSCKGVSTCEHWSQTCDDTSRCMRRGWMNAMTCAWKMNGM